MKKKKYERRGIKEEICDKNVIKWENNKIKMTIWKRKNIRDVYGKEDKKNVRYYYERFEKVETKILNVSKRIFVRLKHNRFEFLVECVIIEVWVVT